MAVELPEPLQWVLLLLAGTRWPEADEDMLRDMAERWRNGAEALEDAGKAADTALKRALDGQQGTAAQALADHWAQFTTGKGTEADPGYFPGLVQACKGMGDMLESMANSAETAKIQIVAQLGILAFEIATAEAEAPFTAGISLAQIPIAVGVSRAVVQQVLKKLLTEALEFAAKQAVQMAAINLMAQGIELMEGHRSSIDMKEVGQNALGGAVAGASGHLIGKGLSGAGSKLGLANAMETTVGKMVHGGAVGVGADVSTQLITTGKVDGGSLLGSGLSGGAGAGLHAGAAAVKGHFNAPAAPPSHGTPPSGGTGGAHGSDAPVFTKPGAADAGFRGPGTGSHTDSGPAAGAAHSPDQASAGTGTPGTKGLVPFGSERPAVGTYTAGHVMGTDAPAHAVGTYTAGHVMGTDAPAHAVGTYTAAHVMGTDAPAHAVGTYTAAHVMGTDAPAHAVGTYTAAHVMGTDAPAAHGATPADPGTPSRGTATPAAEPAPAVHAGGEARPPAAEAASQPARTSPDGASQHTATSHPADVPSARAEASPAAHVEARPAQAETRPVEHQLVQPLAERVPAAATHEPVASHEPTAATYEPAVQPRPVVGDPGAASAPRTAVPESVASAPQQDGHPGAEARVEPVVHATPPADAGGGAHLPKLSGAADQVAPAPRDPEGVTSRLDTAGIPSAPPMSTVRSGAGESGTRSAEQVPPPPPAADGVVSPAAAAAPGAAGAHVPSQAGGTPAPAPRSTTPDRAPAAGPTTGGAGQPRPHTDAGSPGGFNRPLRPQDAERIHQTERDQRQAELAELRRTNDGRVTRTVGELGLEQRFTATRPPEADRLIRELPGMSAQDRARALDSLRPEYRRWLAKDPGFVDALRGSQTPAQFADTAARLMVDVDSRTGRPVSARAEARAQAARMLQDPDVAARLLKAGAGMVVVPKDVSMTDVNAFHNLRGTTAEGASGGGRGWGDVRGSGGRRAGVTEENLLGEDTTIGGGAHYHDGYSTTTHEFAHTIHQQGLPAGDRAAITGSYQKKLADPNATWSDGPRHDTRGEPVDNYGSRDELEYFAQVTNAYLGTNHGTDPHTGQPRNNGPEWVRANEPDLLPLLERLYGPDPVSVHAEPANPVTATHAENEVYRGFREFMEGVDPSTAPAPHGTPNPTAPNHTPPGSVPAQSHPGPGNGNGHTPPPPPASDTRTTSGAVTHPGALEHPGVVQHPGTVPHPDLVASGERHPVPEGMTQEQTVESEFRLGTAALLEQTVIGRLGESALGLPEGALVLGGGGGVAAVELHRPVQDLDMRLSFGDHAITNPNEVLRFLADEVLTDGQVVPGRRTNSTTVTGHFGGLEVSITLAPVHAQEHGMHVVVNGETHNGESVPLKVVASGDLLGDKIAALAMRKQDGKVDMAMLREKRLRDATDVLSLYSKLGDGTLDRLRTERESLAQPIDKLADVVAEVSRHRGNLSDHQIRQLEEISQRLGSERTVRAPKEPKGGGKPTPEELVALREAKRLKAAAAAAAKASAASATGANTSTNTQASTPPPPPTHTPAPVDRHTPPPPPPAPVAFQPGRVSPGAFTPPPPPPPVSVSTGGHSTGSSASSLNSSGGHEPATQPPVAYTPASHGGLNHDALSHDPLSHDPLDHDVEMRAATPEPGDTSTVVDPPPVQRRPLPVAVQTVVVGDPGRQLGGHEVWLGEVHASNDRPMTRFGTDQRSHTVPWGLTRKAASGLAGRSADSVWRELKGDVTHFKDFPPTGRGTNPKDEAMVQARWDDIVRRLDALPQDPPAGQSLQDWHRNLGDLVSGYIEMSQITSFASFADGRAVGHGEAHVLESLHAFEHLGAEAPEVAQVAGTLLDVKATASITPRETVAAKEHLIKSLHRAFPEYMTPARREEFRLELRLEHAVPVNEPGTLPPGAEPFRRGTRSDLVSDVALDHGRISRIMLSEQSRPDTQFGAAQYSHAASWSLMRASLLSFEGRSHQELEGWLGERFAEMHRLDTLDAPTRATVEHAQNELAALDDAGGGQRAARVGDLVGLFVETHQKLTHTTFVDQLQLGQATSSGELDLALLGGDRHDAVVASHFDGAAPFNMRGEGLDRAYRGWQELAGTLGEVGPHTVEELAARSFTDKNMAQLLGAAPGNPLSTQTAQKYLTGLAEWDRAVTTVFPEHGADAVAEVWGRVRDQFTLERFGVPLATDRPLLQGWFDQVRAAGNPTEAAAALAALARYYEVAGSGTSRRSTAEALRSAGDAAIAAGAAVQAAPVPRPGKRRAEEQEELVGGVKRMHLDDEEA